MSSLAFFSLTAIAAYFAGILGALTGLGGGVVIIPVLVVLLHVNIYYAMGASLISVTVTSSGTAIAYLREGYTNLRIGMFLEMAAALGALLGAELILWVKTSVISIIFAAVLLISSYLSLRRKEEHDRETTSHPWAVRMKLNGESPQQDGTMKPYHVQRVPLAWGIMFVAGILSSLLGIGSGALKVLAMDQVMRLPYKVATATSNFIIGITAAMSLGIYFSRSYIEPMLTCPIVFGVLLGSITGANILHRAKIKTLRLVFTVVIVVLALQMFYKGFVGEI